MTGRELKGAALDVLVRRLADQRGLLEMMDARLGVYFDGLVTCSESGTERDFHNLHEILGAVKLLRLLRWYVPDVERVRQVVRLREGEWALRDGLWVHVRGGLLLPGTRGATHYRWEPFQVMVLAALYGVHGWVDTGLREGDRALLETEAVRGGRIMDLRRLCTDFTFFAPRKTDKTGLSAYNNFLFFMLEDADSEVYCCANSQQQAKLLYDRTQALIRQMDPRELRIRFTANMTNWRAGQPRSALLCALSSGGKTKDGLFAQLCCADEFGSAGYVKGRSDMGSLVNVVTSSMGPRREPLLFTSTTAGTIGNGPFVEKLEGLKRDLLCELELDGAAVPESVREEDRRMCLLLMPDEWETGEDVLLSSLSVRRKVNPMLGVIVQHSFYDQAVSDCRLDPGRKAEVLTKLFNVYQSDRLQEWFRADEIRRLQVGLRVDECTGERGWMVFVGCDFSKGDDLNGLSFLCFHRESGQFFADTDVWMSEEAVEASPLRDLYRQWEGDGWLHVTAGGTFDPSVVVSRVVELHRGGVDFMLFGYDPYNAKIVVNALASWLYDLGVREGRLIDPDKFILPVRQNFASYNPVVNEFDYLVRRRDGADGEPLIHFSMNPMWPWQFGNCVLAVSGDGMENRKPVKASDSPGCKVDSVQMLLSALMLFDIADGRTYGDG